MKSGQIYKTIKGTAGWIIRQSWVEFEFHAFKQGDIVMCLGESTDKSSLFLTKFGIVIILNKMLERL